jgi:hypothetical protein
VRGGTGLVAGALRESAGLLVPQSFQNSQTYSVTIRQMLDFLAENVGRVEKAKDEAAEEIDNFLARKAVGNFLEMAALATLHLSPLTVLAVFSDVAYGSQTYLTELAEELKKQGIIDEQSKVHHASDLLSAVAAATQSTSQALNLPPLSVEGLKQTIEETRAAVKSIRPDQMLSEADIRGLWQQMRDLAKRENVDLLRLSGAVTIESLGTLGTISRGALSSVRVSGALVKRHIVDHYVQALGKIRDEGLYRSLADRSEPYLRAVWENFASQKTTITEDLLSGKLVGNSWRAVRRWLGKEPGPTE